MGAEWAPPSRHNGRPYPNKVGLYVNTMRRAQASGKATIRCPPGFPKVEEMTLRKFTERG